MATKTPSTGAQRRAALLRAALPGLLTSTGGCHALLPLQPSAADSARPPDAAVGDLPGPLDAGPDLAPGDLTSADMDACPEPLINKAATSCELQAASNALPDEDLDGLPDGRDVWGSDCNRLINGECCDASLSWASWALTPPDGATSSCWGLDLDADSSLQLLPSAAIESTSYLVEAQVRFLSQPASNDWDVGIRITDKQANLFACGLWQDPMTQPLGGVVLQVKPAGSARYVTHDKDQPMLPLPGAVYYLQTWNNATTRFCRLCPQGAACLKTLQSSAAPPAVDSQVQFATNVPNVRLEHIWIFRVP